MAGISDYNRSQSYGQPGQEVPDAPVRSEFRPYYREFDFHSRSSPPNPPLSPPFHHNDPGFGGPKSTRSSPESAEDVNVKNFAQKGISLVAIVADNLLSHPFLVLRRQCQVHTQAGRYHLFPITLVGPTFFIVQRQGFSVLWKGLGSTLMIRGMTLAVEDVTSKVTPWPKEITRHSSMKAFLQHVLLKALSLALTTPFYSASLVETVQSEVASETTGFFDVFREGFWRLLSWPSTGRLVPLHVLVFPTVTHGILSHIICTGVKSVSLSTIRRVQESKERKQGALHKDSNVSYYMEMTASLVGNMVADILLFPLETILHRLHLQGTRTIIDSLDSGIEVTPIMTSYAGLFDCLRSTVDEEGLGGLYKGFGALILQYGMQMLLIRAVKIVLESNPWGANGNSKLIPSGGIESDRGGYIGSPPIAAAGIPLAGDHLSRSEPSSVNLGRSLTTPTSDLYGHSPGFSSPRGRDPPMSIETRYRPRRRSNSRNRTSPIL